jgi:hypothetical protein
LFITATSAVLVVLVSKGCLYYIELVLLCTFLDVDAFFSCSQGCTLGKEKLPMHVISPTQTILYVALAFSRMNATWTVAEIGPITRCLSYLSSI